MNHNIFTPQLARIKSVTDEADGIKSFILDCQAGIKIVEVLGRVADES